MDGLAHLDEEDEKDAGEPWEDRIERDWAAIEFAPEHYRKDADFMAQLIKASGFAYEFVEEDIREENWKLALGAVRNSFGQAFEWVPKCHHRNREFMLGCVKVSAHVMKHVSNKAHNDEEAKIKSAQGVFFCYRRGGNDGTPFPRGACSPATGNQCGSCSRFLDDPDNCPLPQDRKFILDALRKQWMVLKYADKELQNEKEIVLAAVKSGGWAYFYASEEMQKDRDVALEAVKQNWRVLKRLARKLRADKEIAAAAISQDWHAMKYFPQDIQNDHSLAMQAVRQSWQSFQFLPQKLKGRRDLAHEAVMQDWRAYPFISEKLREDKSLAIEAAKQYGQAIQYSSNELKADLDVVALAIEQDVDALQFASPSIRSEEKVLLDIVKRDGFAIRHATEDAKSLETVVSEAMSQQWLSTEFGAQPCFSATDGLDTDFWLRISLDSGIKGKLMPAFPMYT